MKATRHCSVADCDRPTRSRSAKFCQPHYMANWRYGDPLADRRPVQRSCSHPDGCPEPHLAGGLCSRHYHRLKRTGSLGPVEVLGQGPGQLSNAWKGDNVPYHGAHSRVRRLHGSPSGYPCSHCGGRAQDWAYDHLDPNEKHDSMGRPYSVDPTHYSPLCRVCHYQFDRGGESDEISQRCVPSDIERQPHCGVPGPGLLDVSDGD